MAKYRHLHTHAIAIGIICLVVVVLFFMMKPAPQQVQLNPFATDDNYIRVDSASWGLNCNEEIHRLNSELDEEEFVAEPPPPAAAKLGAAPAPAPAPQKKIRPLVTGNNATLRMGELCNGRSQCEIVLNPQLFESDPLPSCFKQLTLSYRCTSFDRLRRIELAQGAPLKLDCTPEGQKKPSPLPER